MGLTRLPIRSDVLLFPCHLKLPRGRLEKRLVIFVGFCI